MKSGKESARAVGVPAPLCQRGRMRMAPRDKAVSPGWTERDWVRAGVAGATAFRPCRVGWMEKRRHWPDLGSAGAKRVFLRSLRPMAMTAGIRRQAHACPVPVEERHAPPPQPQHAFLLAGSQGQRFVHLADRRARCLPARPLSGPGIYLPVAASAVVRDVRQPGLCRRPVAPGRVPARDKDRPAPGDGGSLSFF